MLTLAVDHIAELAIIEISQTQRKAWNMGYSYTTTRSAKEAVKALQTCGAGYTVQHSRSGNFITVRRNGEIMDTLEVKVGHVNNDRLLALLNK